MSSNTRLSIVSATAVLALTFGAALQAQVASRDMSRDLACSPQALVLPPEPTMRIVGGQEDKRTLFGNRDAVVVSGGSDQGVRVGQEYFVRRVVKDQFALPLSGFIPVSVRTAGWIRVVEIERHLAIAIVTHACDGILEGDFLEPFVQPVEPSPLPPGEPDYTNAGVLILGDDRRQLGAAGALMILDRGSAHGVRPGQRLTIFRDTLNGDGPINRIGEATTVIVRTDTSVVRIERSRDAVYVGDRVAPQR